MNITIMHLTSALLLSSSPCFADHQFSFVNSNFKYFYSHLFLNQKKLCLTKSIFKFGLNGIIKFDDSITEQDNHVTVKDETFKQTYHYISNINMTSLTIQSCIFSNITGSSIVVDGSKTTIYITDSLFTFCYSNEPHIHLRAARYFMMTHTCFSNVICKHSTCILYGDYHNREFCICLYNTIVDTGFDGKPKESVNFLIKNCDSYIKCNNITKSHANAIQFDSITAFTFSMNTIMDCDGRCFTVTGSQYNVILLLPKFIEYVNFFSNKDQDSYDSLNSIFLIDLKSYGIDFTFRNSTILSENNELFSHQCVGEFTCTFINCIINKNNHNNVVYINCTFASYNENYSILLPHYTYGEYCIGSNETDNEMNNTFSALGCNVGKCLDQDCSVTFGFPHYVVPFTTIHHLDLLTYTFTPSKEFSNSNIFSNSKGFTQSDVFSNSKGFTQSDVFSNSKVFIQSDAFSNSKGFTQSDIFSNSKYFTQSDAFSNSKGFTQSEIFSQSNIIILRSFTPQQTPSSSNENNFIKRYYSMTETLMKIRTVVYNYSKTISITLSECTAADGELKVCSNQLEIQVSIPYVIISYFPTIVQTVILQEISLKKKMSKEFIIGVVCLPICFVFAVIGIIIIVKTRRPKIDTSDIYEDSSDLSDDQNANRTNEKIVSINYSSYKNDDWL